MFVRNCWYMAGWSRDFPQERPTPVTILDESIVIYRTAGGTPVAMQDRCCHRFAPLSLGRVEGDDMRCMYHGFKFAPSGKCIEIPGQEKIPPQACVRTYPVVDRHSGTWVWMGDPALADDALVPNFVGIDDPAWVMKPGRMDYNANYVLINDNLLDLSHIAFLHNRSLGAALTPEGTLRPTITRKERSVRIENWLIGQPSQMIGSIADRKTNIWQTYDFVIPGVFLLTADFYPEGTMDRFPDRHPEGVEPLHRQFTCQAVTPIAENRTCYFFAYGPWNREPELCDAFYQLGVKAFNEDRTMIEAQQKNILASGDDRMLTAVMDSGLSQFRRMMNELLRAESKANGAAEQQREARA